MSTARTCMRRAASPLLALLLHALVGTALYVRPLPPVPPPQATPAAAAEKPAEVEIDVGVEPAAIAAAVQRAASTSDESPPAASPPRSSSSGARIATNEPKT